MFYFINKFFFNVKNCIYILGEINCFLEFVGVYEINMERFEFGKEF